MTLFLVTLALCAIPVAGPEVEYHLYGKGPGDSNPDCR